MEALRALLVPALLPELCFEAMRERPLHVQCLKILLSKTLGYGIVLGSVMVKLPQVLKIYGARSGAGLSVGAVGLELLALGGSVAYSVTHGFPFSAWGEALFLLLQTLTIGFLILHYRGSTAWGLLLLLLYAVLLMALLSPWAPPALITALQAANVPCVVGGRLLQAAANHRQSHTGQLSAATTALLLAGSAARVFTAVHDTGDALLILTYTASAACNALLMGQILFYRRAVGRPHSKAE